MFAKRFKELRLQKGWTQGEAARRMDLSIETIHTYENGATPNFKFLPRIAYEFGVSIEYLVIGNKKQKKLSPDFDWFKKYYRTSTDEHRKQIMLYMLSCELKRKP